MKATLVALVLVALIGFSSALVSLNREKLPFEYVEQPQYVRTPAGLVWSECLHHMKSNSHVVENEDGSTVVIDEDGNRFEVPPCEKPILSNKSKSSTIRPEGGPDAGWQVWTTFQHPQNQTFTSFLGYFTVPDAPNHWSTFGGTGILYYFTGLQSDNWVPIANEPNAPANFDIIQPVLQYGGGSTNGGGKYWGIASWYVTLDNGVLYSDLVKAVPGNNIFGNMTQVGESSWVIVSVNTFSEESTTTRVTRPRLAVQPWAYNTMECYDIGSCTWFPPSGSSIDFTQLSLTDAQGSIQPIWKINENDNHCSASLTVPSPDEVVISF